jgi:hypothetical protein
VKRNVAQRARKSANRDGANILVAGTRQAVPKIRPITNKIVPRRSIRATEYPAGSIGSDLLRRAYVKYLVERYHRCRRVEPDFYSSSVPFSYAAIFKAIERKFKAPTYFVPRARFDELVKYLQRRIDGTMLGKHNRAREIRNYSSLEEFSAEQARS